MSLLSSPASRTSPRLVASQSMAYLFIEGNEAKFCDRADLVAGTSVSPGAEKTLATPIVVSLVLFGVPSFLWMVGPQPVSNDWLDESDPSNRVEREGNELHRRGAGFLKREVLKPATGKD